LFVNLKDKNNPGLRRSVTAGDIPAQTFARMTSQVRSSLVILLPAFWECGQHLWVNQPVL
jgi:transcription elongation factor S-II